MNTATLKRYLNERPGQKRAFKRIARTVNAFSPWRFNAVESFLIWALRRRIAWKWMQDWTLAEHAPHFFGHNLGCFRIAFDNPSEGFAFYNRAFMSAEMVRPGDQVLDIGCGDGFFSSRFLADKAAHVDAIDIETSAIETAKLRNPHPKVTFRVLNAVADPFPAERYDLIVWDGAIGHFDGSTTERMLKKIRAALSPDGVFCGSEELGRVKNDDHLQYWETLDDVRRMLSPHFGNVAVRSDEHGALEEFYWRCGPRERLSTWVNFP